MSVVVVCTVDRYDEEALPHFFPKKQCYLLHVARTATCFTSFQLLSIARCRSSPTGKFEMEIHSIVWRDYEMYSVATSFEVDHEIGFFWRTL